MIKWYQSSFNPDGRYISGQTNETIADWLNRLFALHDVISIDHLQIISTTSGMLVLVAAFTPDNNIEV